ncbi:MAG: 5-formyltetrahydrofolate cyclo-ligase [Sulfuritalea sp.]|jgi:5-formyltetrahydrofolate cyclo-ligase|nr:5-formyltetrahydrofolate cyclo-ligase [Sulfuritalea sp.]
MNALPPSAEHDADDSAFRAALRREKLAARLAVGPAEHAALSARVATHLAGLWSAMAAQTLAFCAPVRGEFDARPLVGELLARGWRAAMPVVVETGAPMIFRAWTPDCAMDTDRHDIPIPRNGPEIDPDIVLLPLVAFDAAGYRLGYGGGYFDRTLAARAPRPRAIGVGFELARVADIRPQPHDIRLDAVVTEAGVFSA